MPFIGIYYYVIVYYVIDDDWPKILSQDSLTNPVNHFRLLKCGRYKKNFCPVRRKFPISYRPILNDALDLANQKTV